MKGLLSLHGEYFLRLVLQLTKTIVVYQPHLVLCTRPHATSSPAGYSPCVDLGFISILYLTATDVFAFTEPPNSDVLH